MRIPVLPQGRNSGDAGSTACFDETNGFPTFDAPMLIDGPSQLGFHDPKSSTDHPFVPALNLWRTVAEESWGGGRVVTCSWTCFLLCWQRSCDPARPHHRNDESELLTFKSKSSILQAARPPGPHLRNVQVQADLSVDQATVNVCQELNCGAAGS